MSILSKIKKYLGYLLTARTAHGVHSPFVSKFIHELIENHNINYYQFEELEKLRRKLFFDKRTIEVTDLGAGSKVFKGNKRTVAQLVRNGTSQRKFSELYFKLINFSNAKTIVELGTSIGLNTLYLAKANSQTRVYSIEGCPNLSNFAKQLLRENNVSNAHLINDNFDNALPKLFQEIGSVDLLFVDGNHRYQPTIDYFKMALEKKTNDSVFIFDDIHWSEEMEKAWEEIKANSEVTLSLDLFYVGIVFFRKEQKEKEHFVLRY